MEAVIISGEPAAGKTTAAGMVGKMLGIRAVSVGDVLKEMAADRGYKVTGEGWWDTPDGMKFLAEREKTSDFDKRADEIMIRKVKAGNIVVTSYTLPWISKYGIKIWLHGSPEKRAERMAGRDDISVRECVRIVKQRDDENYKLYRNLYGIEFGKDLKPFDLTIDTDNIPAEEVATIIMDFVKKKTGK